MVDEIIFKVIGAFRSALRVVMGVVVGFVTGLIVGLAFTSITAGIGAFFVMTIWFIVQFTRKARLQEHETRTRLAYGRYAYQPPPPMAVRGHR